MPYEIGKTFEFAAAQRLDGMPEGHPCSKTHGHSYAVEVTLTAAVLDEHGMVLDYHALAPIKKWIDEHLDHDNLNDVVPFNPTAENLAEYLFTIFQTLLAPEFTAANHDASKLCRWLALSSVRVMESRKTFATYKP